MDIHKYLHGLVLFCLLCNFCELFSIPTGVISLVYNLRVSETSQLITEEFKYPFALGFTFFEEARWERRDRQTGLHDRSNALGELVTLI